MVKVMIKVVGDSNDGDSSVNDGGVRLMVMEAVVSMKTVVVMAVIVVLMVVVVVITGMAVL